MTPYEKAVNAINARLERLQGNLREAKGETAQQFLFQSLVATLGVAEALKDYINRVGHYAQRRHGQLKQSHEALGAQHAGLLQTGKELLEKLKANPGDRVVRHEIEAAQKAMADVQKTVRRGANALQRELAPGLAMIDPMSVSVRRLGEADQIDALKRLLKTVVGHVRELYAAHPALPAKDLVDADAWEAAARSEIDQAADFYDAYARTAYQTTLALELMAMALAEDPPQTAEEATRCANEAVAARLKAIAARIAGT